jgi:uncharacterized membrane protein
VGEGAILLLALGLGFVAGLRSLTAPAVVAWAAQLGWINLTGTPLAFMGSTAAVAIFTLAALGEFVTDLLPQTPARTTLVPLSARILMGALAGACLAALAGKLWLGAVLGALGGVAGTFAGYQARTRLVRALNVPDAFVAIPEDLLAIVLAFWFVSL